MLAQLAVTLDIATGHGLLRRLSSSFQLLRGGGASDGSLLLCRWCRDRRILQRNGNV